MNPASVAPRFSVVIPAYNEAGYLEATLESLRRQDFAGSYEVIVVDNNSTDDTAAIATRLGATVVPEPRPGVCWARQRGTLAARGEIVASTDADTVHPPDWLSRLDERFRRHPEAIAVAGPCRYQDPLWWVALFPWLWFTAIAVVARLTGRLFYLTATNVAFPRDRFPGYDTNLTQGGDEFDFLRRLQSRGRIVWDADNPVLTSSRRMDQGLLHTLVVSYGYHYALSLALNRWTSRSVLGPAPAIRREQAHLVRRRRRHWQAGFFTGVLAVTALRRASTRRHPRPDPAVAGSGSPSSENQTRIPSPGPL